MSDALSGWDSATLSSDGVVSVRDLSQHTTQVLKAVEELGHPILVTRNGRVVASISPITTRELVDKLVSFDSDVRYGMSSAQKALAVGDTHSIRALRDQ